MLNKYIIQFNKEKISELRKYQIFNANIGSHSIYLSGNIFLINTPYEYEQLNYLLKTHPAIKKYYLNCFKIGE